MPLFNLIQLVYETCPLCAWCCLGSLSYTLRASNPQGSHGVMSSYLPAQCAHRHLITPASLVRQISLLFISWQCKLPARSLPVQLLHKHAHSCVLTPMCVSRGGTHAQLCVHSQSLCVHSRAGACTLAVHYPPRIPLFSGLYVAFRSSDNLLQMFSIFVQPP